MGMQEYGDHLREQLRQLHLYVHSSYELPEWLVKRVNSDETMSAHVRKGHLGLLFHTALHWDDWTHTDGKTYLGMRHLWRRLDEEYYLDLADDGSRWVYFSLPDMQVGFDWRKTGKGKGGYLLKDPAPMDVKWTSQQIEMLEPGGENAQAT